MNTVNKKIKALLLALVLVELFAPAISKWTAQAQTDNQKLEITPSFAEREIESSETIGLKLNRELLPGEGRFAVFINETDVTALVDIEAQNLVFTPKFSPLPSGEGVLKVYLVDANNDWKTLSEFPLKVKAAAGKSDEITNSINSGNETSLEDKDRANYGFTPNLSLNLKSQNQILTFPREGAPERNPYTDLAGQGNFSFKIERRGWALQAQSDFAGSSYRQEALRFGELGNRAPRIDLSSYLIQFGKGGFSVKLGHVSFGSNRHLINSFSSRGVTVTVPIGKQNELSFAAVNGTSVVGFGNLPGITRRKHSVVSATFAREFFKERPNGLRFEFSVMRGSLLPLTNFNQREVNDAEKSIGFGLKVIGSDARQRLRYEVGFTRSRFTNPSDPLLEQGLPVVPVRATTRNARYADISFDFLQGLKLWREKKLKVTGTYRHEEIEPLFRSVIAPAQADRRQNQFEVSASFGEMNFVYGNMRDRDNLGDIASILKSLTRRNNAIFNIALNSFFTPAKPVKWLPQISYTYDHVHNFGVALPAGGEFTSISQVPDQDSFIHGFNAQWQFSERFRVGYRFNRAFQDNKQPGREQADFLSLVNAFTIGTSPFKSLDLNFDLSRESQENFEQPRTDNTFRFGSNITWQLPLLKNATLSANLSTTLAGDTDNTNDTRNADFDVQLAYKFGFGAKKFKKLDAQFFVRYANHYGDVRDRIFFANNFNKTQTFNAGLTFNIF